MTIPVELTDGRRLEFPDGTDPAVIQATVKRLVAQKAATAPVDPVQPANPTLEVATPFGNLDTRIPIPRGTARSLAGTGAELADMGLALRQRVMRPANALGLVSDDAIANLDREAADKRALDAPLDRDTGAKVGRFTALGATALLPTSTVSGAATLGAVLGALTPTDSEKQALVNMLISGAAGAAGQALGNKVASWLQGPSREVALTPEEVATLRQMTQRGYEPRPAQISKSKAAQALETQLASLPGSAGPMAASQRAQGDRFMADLFGTMGERAPQGVVSPGTTAATQARIGGRIEQAAAGQQLTMDGQLMGDLLDVQAKHSRLLSPDQRAIVSQYIDDIPASFVGQDYQRWRSRIGARAAGTTDSELKSALKGIQAALDSAFDRQATPGASAAMADARGQYRNFKTLEPLIAKAESQGERVAPLNVANRAAQQGNLGGDVADLGRIGRIIGKEGPNSGTAQNQFARDLLTLRIAGASGGAGAGALGGYLLGDEKGAALGAPLGLAASLLAPRAAAGIYLSKALRDSMTESAIKASQKAYGNPTALAMALRALGLEGQPLIEALGRGAAFGATPALLPQD